MDSPQGYRAAREGMAFWRMPEAGIVQASGEDAASFLGGQLTPDVKGLESKQLVEGAYTTAKGRPTAIFTLMNMGGTFLAVVEDGRGKLLAETLEMYHFSEKVKIEHASKQFAVFGLHGPLVAEWLGYENPLPPVGQAMKGNLGAICFLLRREEHLFPNWLLLAPAQSAEKVAARLAEEGHGVQPEEANPATVETLRIETGTPRWGYDFDENTLLSETGYGETRVCYTKGCFLGQEVLARIHNRGGMAKQLMGVVAETEIPLGDGKADGQKIHLGSMTWSPAQERYVGLATVHRSQWEPGRELEIEIKDKSARVTVSARPIVAPVTAKAYAQRRYDEAMKIFKGPQEPEAIPILRQVIRLDPEHADAYEALGVILDRQGRTDEAIEVMEELTRVDPMCAMAHTNLSIFWVKKYDKEKAEYHQNEARMIGWKLAAQESKKKRDAEAEARARKKDLEGKIETFHKVLELDAEDLIAHFGLGRAYQDLDQPEKAVPHFRKAVEIKKDYSTAWAGLGACLAALGKTDEAIEVLEQGIEVAGKKGDLMPKQEMEGRLRELQGKAAS